MKPLLLILLANNQEFGFTVALVGFSIVILALTLLVLVFQKLPKLLNVKLRRLHLKRKEKVDPGHDEVHEEYNIEGNVTAAISMALHMYFNELHDEESGIITIKKVRKSYSPWSSKIYEVTQNWPGR